MAVMTIRNIDRRVSQMKILRAAKNAFENSMDGCFAADKAGKITVANTAMAMMLGRRAGAELENASVADVFPDIAGPFAKALAGEKVQCKLASPMARGGEPFLVSLAPSRRSMTAIEGVVGSFTPGV